MEINIMGDFISFGTSILIGAFIGVLFDLYRTFRYFTKPSKLMSYIEDLLFWIIIVIIFFIMLVKTTDGVLRGFIFIGSFGGVGLYLLTLSRIFLLFFIFIFKLIIEVISEIMKLIFYPFRKTITKIKIHKLLQVSNIFLKEMGRYSKIIRKKK